MLTARRFRTLMVVMAISRCTMPASPERPLGSLRAAGDVTTTGGEGLSLVRGVQVMLQAIALSAKPGGSVSRINIGGRLVTSVDRITTLEVSGALKERTVAGGIHATGQDSDAVQLGSNVSDLSQPHITSDHGKPIVTV